MTLTWVNWASWCRAWTCKKTSFESKLFCGGCLIINTVMYTCIMLRNFCRLTQTLWGKMNLCVCLVLFQTPAPVVLWYSVNFHISSKILIFIFCSFLQSASIFPSLCSTSQQNFSIHFKVIGSIISLPCSPTMIETWMSVSRISVHNYINWWRITRFLFGIDCITLMLRSSDYSILSGCRIVSVLD